MMHDPKKKFTFALFFVLIFVLTACTTTPQPTSLPTLEGVVPEETAPTATSTPTPEPPRQLTVCLAREPGSLFLYGDASAAARSVRAAIYDGPSDIRNFDVTPVILEKKPGLGEGDVIIEPVQALPGDLIVDAQGKLGNLGEGDVYLPSGCNDQACSLTYTGQEAVSLDQLVVHFKLRSDILWSDGEPLTAGDSLFSFEVARSLFPKVRSELVSRTQSYQALDPVTVEWRGIPGYQDARFATHFFTPLPRHAWEDLEPEELFTADLSVRQPLGWGAYKIDAWTPGDSISLSKNPNYFRSAEGLPAFDHLVFRFVPDRNEALDALLSGECDILDEMAIVEAQGAQLLELEQSGQVKVAAQTGTAWEHADFGIASIDAQQPALFQAKETRQAIAMCIDRQRMADELFFMPSEVPDTYVPRTHPLFNPDARHYAYDPQAASGLLQSVGWLDGDNDPTTPRVAQGVVGVPAGTLLEFEYLTTDEDEKQRAAQIVQDSLAQCGVRVSITTRNWEEMLAPGPEGPVFGRNFSMAQFSWITALEPPCFLFMSGESPGPYPDFPSGWGGANASGFSNPDFDRACQQALISLPGSPQYLQAHNQAQAIFAEELPAIPLYLRLKLVVMRPDMCKVILDPSAESGLWNLEEFDYGEKCSE